jgi:hypothetical protein
MVGMEGAQITRSLCFVALPDNASGNGKGILNSYKGKSESCESLTFRVWQSSVARLAKVKFAAHDFLGFTLIRCGA